VNGTPLPLDPSSDPRRRRVAKRRVRVSVAFATSPGTVDTLEGPVAYQTGDAIMTGVAGEHWPVPRTTFFARYEAVEGVEAGDDGPYESLPERAWAVHLDEGDVPLQVVTSAGAVLQAARDDWIVKRATGDVHVVNGDLFWSLYEGCD
jgi:hypothetical protein